MVILANAVRMGVGPSFNGFMMAETKEVQDTTSFSHCLIHSLSAVVS